MHQTSCPNHPKSNGFAECMVGVAKKLMDKAGKERKPWISGLFEIQNHTPGMEHHITFTDDDTAQAQAEKPPTIAQCTWSTRNAPNMPGAHQARKQARESIRSYSQAHQFGRNTFKMHSGNLQW